MPSSTLAPSIHRDVVHLSSNKAVFLQVYHDHHFTREGSLPVRSSSDDRETDSKRRQLRATAPDIIASRRRSISSARIASFSLSLSLSWQSIQAEGLSRSLKCQSSLERAEPRSPPLSAQTSVAGDAREIKQTPFLRWALLLEKSFSAIC